MVIGRAHTVQATSSNTGNRENSRFFGTRACMMSNMQGSVGTSSTARSGEKNGETSRSEPGAHKIGCERRDRDHFILCPTCRAHTPGNSRGETDTNRLSRNGCRQQGPTNVNGENPVFSVHIHLYMSSRKRPRRGCKDRLVRNRVMTGER